MNQSVSSRIRGMVYGSFVADALAMPVHWIYNPSKISTAYGRVETYLDPSSNKYHAGRKPGALCHYGDQMLTLLRSIDGQGGFSAEKFGHEWRLMWGTYDGYVDGATRETLANLDSGSPVTDAGSTSNDLSGASRITPLVACMANGSPEDLVASVRLQTRMTHNHPQVIEAAGFFALLLREVLEGRAVAETIDDLAGRSWIHIDPSGTLEAVKSLMDRETVEAVGKLGLTCHFGDAFPSTLYLLLKYSGDFREACIQNAMAGGDSTARGLLIGGVLGASTGLEAIPEAWVEGLQCRDELSGWLGRLESTEGCGCSGPESASGDSKPPGADFAGTLAVSFPNRDGVRLDARLEFPRADYEKPVAFAIFAHCFTCSKDILAASRISRGLAARGIAVLRFDFTGIGNSDGDFSNTNFSSNVDDLVSAAEFLAEEYESPSLLVGHSLGGAAVIAAVNRIGGIRGLVTLGAPSDPGHVSHLFKDNIDTIQTDGVAEVRLGGRKFKVRKQFLEDIRNRNILHELNDYRGAILVMHAPTDDVVSIEHAGRIFSAARHPRSFVALTGSNHLMDRPEDASFASEIIGAWIHHHL